ncbi:hypothetical protein [Roseivirga sp. 4D4]|uniref:hypothetical protein n=1 Tax=Roseivirga sp. 4D4 TaxID=1889784 RepID=UPI001112E60A|nr:hypothetical protein [Roseivirga sp. 4D4]
MKNSNLFSILAILLLSYGCSFKVPESETWQLVYRNDAEGNTVFGDKSQLLDAVRNGLPIRIGFGGRSRIDSTRSVEHVADAQFLSILDGDEVFAQITQIIGQAPAREADGTKIRFRTNNKWTTIRGTNGYSTGLMVDYMADTLVGQPGDGRGATSWFVYIKETSNKAPKRLYD